MKRDFTEATKTEFINLVQEANESEWLKKKNPLDNVDDLLTFDVQFPWNTLEAYYRKMIDKNDMTAGKIKEIWENVQILDATYQARFLALNELAVAYKEKLRILSDKIKPENIVNTLYSSKAQLQQELLNANSKINIAEMKHNLANINFYKSWLCDSEKKYNWELIEKYLNGDIRSISEEEYMAFIMILGDMNVKDLEKFANKAYIGNKELGYAKLSPFFIELSKRYSEITEDIAQNRILDLVDYNRENLKKHCTTSAILSCICKMKKPGTMMNDQYVFLTKNNKKYVVELNYTDFINYDSPLGVAIEIDQKNKRNQRFEILSWGSSYFIEHNLDKKTILEIAGEKKTDAEVIQEKVASFLLLSGIEKATNSTYATVIEMVADIQNNQENNIKLDTSITNIEVGNYIKALGLNGNIIYENNNKVFMQNVMINKVELNIRVHVYNKTNADITVEELISDLKKGGKVLKQYEEWYGSGDKDNTGKVGEEKVMEYKDRIKKTWDTLANEYPEINIEKFENLSEEQMRELIKKTDNPLYKIDIDVMEKR